MELKELVERTKELFEIDNIETLSCRLREVCLNNKHEYMEKFEDIESDLSVDWLQKIFQYYQADRKEKMQDYTPTSLARFIGKLSGNSDIIIDMCAGSGALTIQKWNLDHDKKFILYEFDENVIPFLIFNMMLRNIDCIIYHADVLQQEVFHTYQITKGDRYGNFKEVENGNSTYF